MAEHEQQQPDRSALDELAVLADDLLAEAAAARQRWAELSAVLGVDAPAAPAAPANGAEPAPPAGGWLAAGPSSDFAAPAPLVPAPPAAAVPVAPAPPPEPDPDPIRLVALDMMLSGRTREEVDAYLSATFGDGIDPAIVDDVFDVDTGDLDPDDAADERFGDGDADGR